MDIETIISKSLAGSQVDVDLEAGIAWQRRPVEIADYLKQHIQSYNPEERRLLYIKSGELTHGEMISLLAHALQHEEDVPALKLIETVLMDRMTPDDVDRCFGSEFHCKSRLATKIVQSLCRHLG